MNIQMEHRRADNGVNFDALLDAREALRREPEAAQFTWRARCEWIDGVHTRSTVDCFFGLGQERCHKQPFAFDADHPTEFAATDYGATPVEILLSALASCLTGGIASIAQQRGIQLRSVVATVEGDMDVRGVLGVDTDARNGFNAIRVGFDINAHATREEIAALVTQSQQRSAVFDIITNQTNVRVSVV